MQDYATLCKIMLKNYAKFCSLASYLHNVSKEQASYWAADTRKGLLVSTARFMFPVMPLPSPQTWAHVEGMHKWALELACIDGTAAAEEKMTTMIDDMNKVCPNESLPLH